MAMERFLTSLVFCEAPLDSFVYGAPPAGGGAKLAAAAQPGDAPPRPAEEPATKTHRVSIKPAWRQAEFAPAFDGLHCFETVVVMPVRPRH